MGFGSARLVSSAQAADLPAAMNAFPILASWMVPAWFLVLVFGTMVAVLAVVLAVIGRFCAPKVPRATIYALSPVVSALLIFAFYWLKMVIGAASEEENRASYTQAQAQSAELIDLKGWWLVPDGDKPQAAHLEIAVRASGRVRAQVRMGAWPSEAESQGRMFLMEQPTAPCRSR